jgi:hypothetical protein
MSFFFNHKFFSLLIILSILYWYINPAHKFGVVNKWVIVYNRIPVVKFDFYVDPSGGIFFEDDLANRSSLSYWFTNHLCKDPVGAQAVDLFVGTGFDSSSFNLNKEILDSLQTKKVYVHQLLVHEAIGQYNQAVNSGIKAAILVKNR